jgi:hypothetical protein
MALVNRSRTVARAAGAATMAAPYVRAFAQDEELRASLRDLARSVSHLYSSAAGHDGVRALALDDSVREDVDSIVASLQEGARRLAEDTRPRRHLARRLVVVAALGGAAAVAVYFIGRRGPAA